MSQDSSLSVSTPIHLTDGNGAPLRCCMVIPQDGTGETAVLCGAVADFYCAECGPLCNCCWGEMPCFHTTARHLPVRLVARNANDVLAALLARRITPEYALVLLRHFGAAQWMIQRVEVIEAETIAEFVRSQRRVSPLWKIANTEAAAELTKRASQVARIGNGLFVRVGKGGAR